MSDGSFASNVTAAQSGPADSPTDFDAWRLSVRRRVLDHVSDFASRQFDEYSATAGDDDMTGPAREILRDFLAGGKCLRSTFMYLGWLCGAPADDAALRAVGSLELLHAFALLQDDVMDNSAERRGRPAAHIQFRDWHQRRALSGSASRFGASAATLLGDLCLIWAEQVLRESGVEPRRLQRAWPRYDAMRTELAIGQFADLSSDVRDLPSIETMLRVIRLKSGNYTVRRPLEIGAAMAGCDELALCGLGRYGSLIGEAFHLRDDILGVFGSPESTGKPSGDDLLERKATILVLLAHQMATDSERRELTELMNNQHIDGTALDRWRTLITDTGATARVEQLISERVAAAHTALGRIAVDGFVREALEKMADVCTQREQ